MSHKKHITVCFFGIIALLTMLTVFLLHVSADRRAFARITDTLFQEEAASGTLTLHYTLSDPEIYGITETPVRYAPYTQGSSSSELYLKKMCDISPASLSVQDQITYDLLLLQLKQNLEGEKFSCYPEPLGATIGIQAQLPVLLCEYRFDSKTDIRTYLKLLSTTDQYFAALLAYERQKAAAGLFMPDCCADGIISQCRAFCEGDLSSHLLVTVFDQKINDISFLSPKEKQTFREENLKIVQTFVLPAYQLLINGLTDLKKSCKNQMGLAHLPDGRSYYEYLVQSSVGTSLSVPDIQSRIQKQLLKDVADMKSLAFAQTSDTSFSFLPSDPQSILSDLMQKMSHDFPHIEKTTCELKTVAPALSPYLSPAFYLTAPIDRPDQNVIYLNLSKSDDRLSLYTTLAHEGFPGHLYQNRYCASFLSPLRSLLSFGGYTEGWATYVEMLSYDYAALGQSASASAAVFLARKQHVFLLGLSSLLDIYIHYYGFTRQEVSHFLSQLGIQSTRTANSIYDAILESPGNYLKYYFGYLSFLDLQNDCRQQWPDQFSLSDFHRRILEIGPCQFPVLEKYLKASYE